MANIVKIKRSGSTSQEPSILEDGELALNYADGKLFYKNLSNAIIGSKLITNISGTANQVVVTETTGSFTVSLANSVIIQDNLTVNSAINTASLFVDSIEIDTTGAVLGKSLVFDGTKFAPATAATAVDTSDKYTQTIGNRTDSTYTITHGLGTRNVVVSIVDANSPYSMSKVDWEATTINTVTLNFANILSTNSRVVTIQSVGSGELFTTTIGDAVNTEFEIDHNLGIFDTFAVIRNASSPYEVIEAQYFPITIKKSKVQFSSPPSLNSIVVSVFAPLAGYVYSETIGDDTNVDYTINHNLDTRNVNVFCRDKVSPYEHTMVAWRAASNDSIVVSFETIPSGESKEIYVFSSIGGSVEFTDVIGTTNQVTVSENSGTFTISLPSNISTTTATFTSLFVDNIEIDTTGAQADQILKFNGTKFLPSTQAAAAGGGGAVFSELLLIGA